MKRFFLAAALALTVHTAARAEEPMIPVFDLHTDVLYRMSLQKFDLVDAPSYISVSIPHMQAGGVTEQVFSLWIDPDDHPGMDGAQQIFRMMDLFDEQQTLHSDKIALAHNMAEADAIKAQGKTAIFFVIEGAAPINNDLAMLRTYYRNGVRLMTLTWMQNLDWAGSSTDKVDSNKGLNDFGKDVVKEMNRLGMVVDVSHVSDATFYDAIATSSDPVIVSHSGCRALCDHPRDVTDDMLRALAKNGGVIGIVAYSGYLDPNWNKNWDAAEAKVHPQIQEMLEKKYGGDKTLSAYRAERRDMIQAAEAPEDRSTIEIMLDHIDHAIEVAGPEHVGLGSDFDGVWSNLEGLGSPAQWQSIAEGMRKRGHSEEVIKGVMGDNIRRVFRQVMDK